MRGTYFLGNGEFETRDMPERPLGPHDVRIQVAACGVCGTDVHIYHGDKGSAEVTPPVVLGHELAGAVTELGAALGHDSDGGASERVAVEQYAIRLGQRLHPPRDRLAAQLRLDIGGK